MGIKNPRIAVLAATGRCLRDWLLSDFIPVLTQGAEVIIFTPQADVLRKNLDIPSVSFEWMEARPLGHIQQNLAVTLQFAHRYRHPTYMNQSKLSSSLSGWGWRSRLRIEILKVCARFLLKRFKASWVEMFERAFLGLMGESRRLEEVLRQHRIDLVFSTLPLIAHYERSALWAAQRLGIPTVCAITSWDNLYGKGGFPVCFSHYLVWSEHMRHDLLAHYPDLQPDAVTIVGAPQFDFYLQPDMLQERAAFIRSIGGDPSRKLIVWSGVSPNQMPNEPAVVELLGAAARAGRLYGNPQILVRPHPIGGGARFAQLRKRYPEILFTETNATDTNYLIHWLPLREDAALLVNSIAHCDVNINHCSTMTLDACVLDQPVVNIAFDLESGSEMEADVRNCYLYDHYRSVLELGAVRLAYSLDELITHVNTYLANPALEREGRVKLLRLQCGEVDGRAAERAAKYLLRLVGAVTAESLATEVR